MATGGGRSPAATSMARSLLAPFVALLPESGPAFALALTPQRLVAWAAEPRHRRATPGRP